MQGTSVLTPSNLRFGTASLFERSIGEKGAIAVQMLVDAVNAVE
jgi:hypothetical protein